jgi:hypothetical protein
MSFLKRLFGGGGGGAAKTPAADPVEYKGYTITPTPYQEEGQFQTCGVVTREIDGHVREHRFIRADRFPGIEEAVAHSIRKGKQMVDEQGERMFSDR